MKEKIEIYQDSKGNTCIVISGITEKTKKKIGELLISDIVAIPDVTMNTNSSISAENIKIEEMSAHMTTYINKIAEHNKNNDAEKARTELVMLANSFLNNENDINMLPLLKFQQIICAGIDTVFYAPFVTMLKQWQLWNDTMIPYSMQLKAMLNLLNKELCMQMIDMVLEK